MEEMMRKNVFERTLGLTLAAIVGMAAPVTAFAQSQESGAFVEVNETEDFGERVDAVQTTETEAVNADDASRAASDEETASEEDAEAKEPADFEETAEAEELPEEENLIDDVVAETEDSALLGSSIKTRPEVNLNAEFIGFGDEVDAFIGEHGQDAYEIKANRYSDDEYYLDVVLKTQPFMTNAVLEYVTLNDSDEHVDAAYYESHGGVTDCFGIDLGKVPVEYLSSGETLRFYAHWTKSILKGYSLDANGGVFDDSALFGGSTITYTAGDSISTRPVEGKDDNTTAIVTYNTDKTVAYVPVMRNGFLPVPVDGAGVSMDLAGRPYDGEKLPFLGWNTKRDGSGEYYTDETVLLEKDCWPSDNGRLDDPVTLYAIFPEYYGAEFILDGVSYVGDYWTDTPDATRTESLENLFSKSMEGSEDKLVKEGYTLSWYLNEDCTIPADLTTRIDYCRSIRERVTVYGKWTEIVPETKREYGTVIFRGLEGEDEEIKLEIGKSLDLSKYLFTKKGYTFKNWTATVNGRTRTYAKSARISKLFAKDGEEFTLNANWVLKTYKISYNLDGGRQEKKAPKAYNVETEVQLPTPVKAGFVFKGWDVKADGRPVTDDAELDSIYDAESNRIKKGTTGNITLFARFVPFGYRILFHVKGYDEPLTFDDYGADEPLKYTDSVNFNMAAMEIEDALEWIETEAGQNRPFRDLKIMGFSRTEGGKADFDRIKNYTKLTDTEQELHLYAITKEKTYEINYHLDEYEGATLTKPLYTFKSGNKRFALPKAKCPGYKFYGWEFDFSRNSDKSLFYNYVRMCTPYECDAKFALTVAESVNNDIEVRPYFVPNKIKVYVSPNGSDVYEDVNVETYEGTDIRARKVSGKRAFGVVYYNSDSLASEWYDETMDSWYRPGYDFVGYSKNPKAASGDEIFDKLYYGIENFSDVATSGSGTIYCIWKKSELEVYTYPATLLDGKEVVDEAFDDYDYPDFDAAFVHGSGKTIKLPKAELPGYEFLGWKLYNMDKPDRFTKVTMKGGYVTAVSSASGYSVDIYPVFRRCVYDLAIDCNGGSYGRLKKFYVARDLDFDEEVSRYLLPYTSVNVQRKGYRLMGFARDKKGETGMVLNADGMPLYNAHSLTLNGNGKVTLYAIWKKIKN